MATPLSADAIVKALKDEGVNLKEHSGWRTHNRNHKGAWGPVYGLVIHHTAGNNDREVCYNGYSALPGPLCQSWAGRDGSIWMLGNGRCNHAGNGDDDVLRAVINESALPADNEANTDGNRSFYGLEIENFGTGQSYPSEQYDQAVRWAAAICRAHGWTEKSIIGHKEWQPGKIDPSFNMNTFRADVKERLASPAGGESAPVPTTPVEDDEMPKYVSLGRSDSMPLARNVWDAIEFFEEWSDESGDHADGGSQFVKGPARFTGELNIEAIGLPEGEELEVMLSEVKSMKYIKDHKPVVIKGSDPRGVTLVGRIGAGRGMRVRVRHDSDATVSVKAYLKAVIFEEN